MRVDLRPASLVALVSTGALLGASWAVSGCGGNPATGSATSSSSGDGGGGGGGGAGGNSLSVGDLSTSDQSSSEHEPQIVLGNGGRVVASWVDRNNDPNDEYHVAYRVSDDRGATWGPITSIAQKADNNIASNATLAAANDGAIYLGFASEYVDSSGTRSHQHVWLATLAPGESSFEEPIELTDPADVVGVYDQPAITVTKSGRLLVTYGEASPNLSSIWIVAQTSDDDGATWTKRDPLFLDGAQTYQNLIHPCVSPDGGGVYLYYLDENIGLTLWPSHDDGTTFAPADRIAVQADDEEATFSPMLDANCVASGDEVWVAYGITDQQSPANQTVPRLTHVALAHSSDAGASFDWRARVEDAEVGPRYLLPRVAVEGGVIDVAYYAGTGEGDANASYRTARSSDGGMTFGPSVEVRAPVTYELKRSTEQWFGDYMGLKASPEGLYGVFIDNSAPQAHVSFFTESR